MLVAIERHILARLGVAAHAVLRTVKRGELHPGLRTETLDDAAQLAIDAGRIGDQADAFAAHEIEMLFEENVDAEFHSVESWTHIVETKKPRRTMAPRLKR